MTAKPRNHEPQSLKETLYRVIFESDTRAGRLFDRILIFVILFSILVVVLDSVQSISAKISYYPLFLGMVFYLHLHH